MRRRLALLLAPLVGAATLGALVLTGPTASAYGRKAQWQIGFSANCNNPTICGQDGLGGFWGWAEFDSDNTADAQLTGCGHLVGPHIPGTSGAGHYSDEVDGWFIAPGSTGLDDFWIESETATFTGHGPPVTVFDPFPPYPMDTGIPAVAGHYSTAELFEFTAPGVSFQAQVVQIPGH
jgi:hypothetical protein